MRAGGGAGRRARVRAGKEGGGRRGWRVCGAGRRAGEGAIGESAGPEALGQGGEDAPAGTFSLREALFNALVHELRDVLVQVIIILLYAR